MQQDPKQSARQDRLQRLRPAQIEQHRNVLKAEAKEKCVEAIEKFVNCAKANNLMVVFKCRTENTNNQYYNETIFKKYMLEKGYEI